MIEIKGEDVNKLNNLLDYIRLIAEIGVTPSVEEKILKVLERILPLFPYVVFNQEFPTVYRLTVNKRVVDSGKNKRIRNIKYLKYPPANKVSKYGRCNLPSQSVFYATSYGAQGGGSLVTMNEMKPEAGNLVTESTWKIKGNQTLKCCPIFKNQPPNNVLNPRTWKINRLHEEKLKTYPLHYQEYVNTLIQFVADAFTKRFDSNNHLNYIFSAYFSDKILHSFEGGTIDAIWYPSVKNNLTAENLAIKADVFDNKYEIFEVRDSIMTAETQFGARFDGLSECKSFDVSSGEILWDPKIIRQPTTYLERLQNQFEIDLS